MYELLGVLERGQYGRIKPNFGKKQNPIATVELSDVGNENERNVWRKLHEDR